MSMKRVSLLIAVACVLVAPRICPAQDIHVYTAVFDQQAPQSQPIARSLSLFHGGKTYDFIQELGEVIIFEPAMKRFTLLNTRQMKATTVLCEELNGQLKVARAAMEENLAKFTREKNPQLFDQLKFQLNPQFEEQKEKEGSLTLQSDSMQYKVKYAPLDSAEKTDAYLNYADWTCRLNYVLDPGKLYPEPRLAVNAALRKLQAVPTEVELIADVQGRIHLRAEHTIHLNLDEKDRELIHQWEQLLAGKDLKRVTVHEYQRALLVGQRK